MTEQMSNLLMITGALCLVVLLWVLSIALVYWDAARRQVGGLELAAWVALAALLPLIGLLAYMFYRLLGVFISPSMRQERTKKKRETMLKPISSDQRKSFTVPAIEYGKTPNTSAGSTRPPLTEHNREAAGDVDPVLHDIVLRLVVIEGKDQGKHYILRQLPAVIGRGPEVPVSLDDDRGVSRLHAEIYGYAGVVRIRDLKSTHGTQVNGFDIGDKALDSGDKIQIGRTVLMVDIQGLDDGG